MNDATHYTYTRERRQMLAALAPLKVGARYWLDRNPRRKEIGLHGGWGEVVLLDKDGACPYVRDCQDGDVYPVDPRDLRKTKPAKETA